MQFAHFTRYTALLVGVFAIGCSNSETLAILGVSATGELSLLGRGATASGAHCVTADASGNAYVCDPGGGRLRKFHDGYSATP